MPGRAAQGPAAPQAFMEHEYPNKAWPASPAAGAPGFWMGVACVHVSACDVGKAVTIGPVPVGRQPAWPQQLLPQAQWPPQLPRQPQRPVGPQPPPRPQQPEISRGARRRIQQRVRKKVGRCERARLATAIAQAEQEAAMYSDSEIDPMKASEDPAADAIELPAFAGVVEACVDLESVVADPFKSFSESKIVPVCEIQQASQLDESPKADIMDVFVPLPTRLTVPQKPQAAAGSPKLVELTEVDAFVSLPPRSKVVTPASKVQGPALHTQVVDYCVQVPQQAQSAQPGRPAGAGIVEGASNPGPGYPQTTDKWGDFYDPSQDERDLRAGAAPQQPQRRSEALCTWPPLRPSDCSPCHKIWSAPAAPTPKIPTAKTFVHFPAEGDAPAHRRSLSI